MCHVLGLEKTDGISLCVVRPPTVARVVTPFGYPASMSRIATAARYRSLRALFHERPHTNATSTPCSSSGSTRASPRSAMAPAFITIAAIPMNLPVPPSTGGGLAGSSIAACDDTVWSFVKVGGFVSLHSAGDWSDLATTDCSQNEAVGRDILELGRREHVGAIVVRDHRRRRAEYALVLVGRETRDDERLEDVFVVAAKRVEIEGERGTRRRIHHRRTNASRELIGDVRDVAAL